MKRTNSLIGAILATVINGIQVFFNGYILIAFFAAMAQIGTDGMNALGGFLIALAVIIEICCIVGLVFSILSFTYISADHEKYVSKKKYLVTSIVFNFIIAFIFIIACFDGRGAGSIVFYIISMLALIAANVLYILDMKKEKTATVEKEEKVVEAPKADEVKPNEENKESK